MIDRQSEYYTTESPHKNPELWAGRFTLSGAHGLDADVEPRFLDYLLKPHDKDTVRAAIHVPLNTDFVVASLVLRTFSESDEHRPQEAFEQMSFSVLVGLQTVANLPLGHLELEQARICRYQKLGQITGELIPAMNGVIESAIQADQAQRLFAVTRDTMVEMQATELLSQAQ